MAEGYCTLEDVRRALRKAKLPGDISQDTDIAVDAIAAQSIEVEKSLKRHWYAEAGDAILDEADQVDIPKSAKTRDDEHDIPRHAGLVHGASEQRRRRRANSDSLLESGPRYHHTRQAYREPKREIRIAFGDPYALDPPVDDTVPAYTRITLDRRDVEAVNELHVANEDGGFDDWVADSDFDGGVGNQHRGEDYWVRINNGGVSELYLDVHAMDDDIASLSKAVYIDIDYGHAGIPRHVRRAVALLAASDFAQEATIQIPENASVYNVETLADRFERRAEELLEVEAKYVQ